MDEERIGLFIDYENLAIGARDDLGIDFDFKPIADALAERGRVVVRRAYADWTYFESDRRILSENHVEMIEIPQRTGMVRKNAADIKMAVDAIELAFERDYVTTFVICTGDSDFTPLVHKLRELNKRVIGVGLKASTSKLLAAGVRRVPLLREPRRGRSRRSADPSRTAGPSRPTAESEDSGRTGGRSRLTSRPSTGAERHSTPWPCSSRRRLPACSGHRAAPVRSSMLKRAVLRKDPTFSEGDYGFRAFGELLRHFADSNVLQLSPGGAPRRSRGVVRRIGT